MSTGSTTAPVPALKPPDGVASDFDGVNPLEKWNIVLQTLCIAVPSILITIRCWVRFYVQHQRSSTHKTLWHLEDALCLTSWALLIAYALIVIVLVANGGGHHQWDRTKDQTRTILYWLNVGQIVYSMAILFAKVSVLYLYLTIFAPARWKARWWVVVGMIAGNSLFYLALMGSKIGQCSPRDRIWNKDIPGTCVSLEAVLDTSGTWNTVSDVAILACPLLFILKLQLNRQRKLAIFGFFTVGIIAPAFSLVGVIYRVQIDGSPDLTYYQPRVLFFALAEVACGNICTCLPVLPRFFRWCRGSKGGSSQNASENYQSFPNNRRWRSKTRHPHVESQILRSQYIELDGPQGSGRQDQWLDQPQDERPGSGGKNQIWKTTEIRVQHETAESSSVEEENYIAEPTKAARKF